MKIIGNNINIDIITYEPLPPLITVNHATQPLTLQSEIIQESTVLTPLVGIARIVGRRIIVTEKQYQSRADSLSQHTAALNVCLFRKKHSRQELKL